MKDLIKERSEFCNRIYYSTMNKIDSFIHVTTTLNVQRHVDRNVLINVWNIIYNIVYPIDKKDHLPIINNILESAWELL